MDEKMEKIAPIPTVQFLFKSDGHKSRSVRFNVNFYCYITTFSSRRITTVVQKTSFFAAVVTVKNYIKIHISNLVGDMNVPIGISLDPN